MRSRVTTINAHAPISMEEFKRALTECAMDSGELEPYTLTEADLVEIRKLREEKYATWAWNYGFSPAYDMRREMKFPTGLITARLSAEQGRIKGIRFYGDFFGHGDLEELETAMVGLPLDEHLTESLEPLHEERYISGIIGADVNRLLRG